MCKFVSSSKTSEYTIMKKCAAILRSMRFRTLPLSLAGVVLGLLLAASQCEVSWSLAVTLLLTTVGLQILSNLSNELGDYLRGTDSGDRQGPAYSLQEGALSEKDMRWTIGVMVVFCCLMGCAMTWCSFGTLFSLPALLLLLLGACAIWAAVNYTLGKHPYGYRGLGDIFVFIFFGLVSVGGAYFVVAHQLPWKVLLPASAIGCFSVGVLNVNNIRDMNSDAGTRVTVPLKIGEHNARIYQTCLVVVGWLLLIGFAAMESHVWYNWLFMLTLPLYIVHLRGVWRLSGKPLDAMLPLLVMSTFVLSLLMGVGFVM